MPWHCTLIKKKYMFKAKDFFEKWVFFHESVKMHDYTGTTENLRGFY